MNSEKQVDFILEVFHRVKAHMEQERMGPAGTPSSVLLAEERSGSDSKRPLTDASGSPLPDQAEAMVEDDYFLAFEVWLGSEEGKRQAADSRLLKLSDSQSIWRAMFYAFIAGGKSEAARHAAEAQSEVEAAQAGCPHCGGVPPKDLAICCYHQCPMKEPAKRAERSESGNR